MSALLSSLAQAIRNKTFHNYTYQYRKRTLLVNMLEQERQPPLLAFSAASAGAKQKPKLKKLSLIWQLNY